MNSSSIDQTEIVRTLERITRCLSDLHQGQGTIDFRKKTFVEAFADVLDLHRKVEVREIVRESLFEQLCGVMAQKEDDTKLFHGFIEEKRVAADLKQVGKKLEALRNQMDEQRGDSYDFLDPPDWSS